MVFKGSTEERLARNKVGVGWADFGVTLQKGRESVVGNWDPSGGSPFFRSVLEKSLPAVLGCHFLSPSRGQETRKEGGEERSGQKVVDLV